MGVTLLLSALALVYGPRALSQWKLMRLQEACMSAEMPEDRPVYETEASAVEKLIARHPAEYQLNRGGWALRIDPRWVAFSAEVGWVRSPASQTRDAAGTTFLHERYTPDGRRRLVVLEGLSRVTVYEPAGWTGGKASLVWVGNVNNAYSASTLNVFHGTRLHYDVTRFGAGRIDTADRSRFIVPFVLEGVPGALEYQLQNDDQLSVRLRGER